MLRLALLLTLASPDVAPRLAVPPWPLAPDGELVAAPVGQPLIATGGAVEPVAPGLWRVVPDRLATEVVLRAGTEQVAARVEPPPARIELTWSPAVPVKGRDGTAVVDLVVLAEGGAPDPDAAPPRLQASAGRIGAVERVGPGRFRASYELPATRYPEVAALFALTPRCPTCATPAAQGSARLPLAAAIELPGQTDPGVTTHVEVGGAVFGPVKADRAGRFRLPVVIPPGASRGVARSVSALGNERRKPIDLGLPPAPRLACLAHPARLPADGQSRASLRCLAHAATGTPRPDARLELSAARGAILGQRLEDGVVHAEYQAPRGGAGPVEVTVAWREAGGEGRTSVRLELVTGGPARIDWSVADEPLLPGQAAAATAVARDARGEALGPARAEGPRGEALAGGRFVARPEIGDGADPLALAFALPPAAPEEAATLLLRREGEAWVAQARSLDGRPARGVALAFGEGPRAVTDERGEARAPAAGPTEWVTGPERLRAAAWGWAPPPPAPVSLERRVLVALRPPAAVDVAAAFDGRFVTWTVRGVSGEPEPARRVVLRTTGVSLGPPERLGQGGRCAVLGGRGPVAVIDAESGSAALVEVR